MSTDRDHLDAHRRLDYDYSYDYSYNYDEDDQMAISEYSFLISSAIDFRCVRIFGSSRQMSSTEPGFRMGVSVSVSVGVGVGVGVDG